MTFDKVRQAAVDRFGPLARGTEETLEGLKDAEFYDALMHDIPKFESLAEFSESVAWFSGRQVGKIDGLRTATYLLLGVEDNEELDTAAFEATTLEAVEAVFHRAIAHVTGG